MTIVDAVRAVRSATAHDNDRQFTDDMVIAELDREYRRTRRWLSSFAPTLYQKVGELVTLTSSQHNIAKPTDFERVVRLEQQMGQEYWQPLCVRAVLHQSEGIARDCAGTYRLTYVACPVNGYSSFDVPEGAEDIIIQNVAGWARQRHEEDPTWHMQRAAQIKNEIRLQLSMRYGAHPVSLLQSQFDTGWVGAFYEQGAYLVVV